METNYDVEYRIGCYHGHVEVSADINDDNEIIIAKAKGRLINRTGPLPLGSESFKITAKVQ